MPADGDNQDESMWRPPVEVDTMFKLFLRKGRSMDFGRLGSDEVALQE